jgi:signal transduction histidine kinase
MSQSSSQSSSLEQILITEELFRRVPRPVNLGAENHALHKLAQQLAESSQALLQSLVSVAVDLCQAGSAGISIPEVKANGEEIFRWVALAGAYANSTGSVPRRFSLCNTCVERRTPQLYAYPERYFTYFQQLQPPMVECLVIPLLLDTQALGTIWIVSHDETHQFDLEDVRVMSSLAHFTAAALHHAQTRYAAEATMVNERAARREAEQADRLKDEFLAIVFHELRTPLSNIKMAIRLLQVCQDLEQRERYLRILETECDREIAIVNNLLDLQRLELGVDTVEWSPIDLQEWLLPIVEPFGERARAAQQVLTLDLPVDLPLVMIDPIKLERIITELLNNACKYTPAGGEIHLKVNLTLNLFDLTFTNTGIEIPADALPQIFEKFYRVPHTIYSQSGTGLGLNLVKQRVELLGGKITVESHNNLTAFMIKLPRLQADSL